MPGSEQKLALLIIYDDMVVMRLTSAPNGNESFGREGAARDRIVFKHVSRSDLAATLRDRD
jgi:hypothetical protein